MIIVCFQNSLGNLYLQRVIFYIKAQIQKEKRH